MYAIGSVKRSYLWTLLRIRLVNETFDAETETFETETTTLLRNMYKTVL